MEKEDQRTIPDSWQLSWSLRLLDLKRLKASLAVSLTASESLSFEMMQKEKKSRGSAEPDSRDQSVASGCNRGLLPRRQNEEFDRHPRSALP